MPGQPHKPVSRSVVPGKQACLHYIIINMITGGRRVKNIFLKRSVCVLLTAGMLTGCSMKESDEQVQESAAQKSQGTSAVQETTSGPVSLTVWAEEDNFEMLEGMIASFKEHYSGQAEFEISLTAQPDSGMSDMILGDIHSAGDVFSFPDDQFARLMAAGVLEPVENAAEISAANVPEAIAAASYKDVLYAFPYTADNGYFLYYDKDYFTPEDVETMDGLLAAAQEAGKQISMELNSGWYLYSFFGQTGLTFGVNEDGVTNYCDWNAVEGSIKGVDVAQAILDITASPAFSCNTDGDFVAKVQDGSVVAGVSGTWNALQIKEAWGEDYGAVKLPTFTCAGQQVQMSSFTGYKMMGVNAYSEQKGWAMKLADWLTNEENQTQRFLQRNQVPSNIKAAASDAASHIPAVQAILEQSKYGNLQRVGSKYWTPCTDFANILIDGNPNNIDLQELMDSLVAGITASTAE